jgi:hypothetical protein
MWSLRFNLPEKLNGMNSFSLATCSLPVKRLYRGQQNDTVQGLGLRSATQHQNNVITE